MNNYYIYVPSVLVLIQIIYIIIKTIINYKNMISSIYHINAKSLEQKMDLVDTTLDVYEQSSVINVKKLLKKNIKKEEVSFIDMSELLDMYCALQKEHQELHYRFAWVDNKHELKTMLKKMIKRNGFHKKTGDDLGRYIDTAFKSLLTESKNNVNSHMDSYPALSETTPEQRFNVDDGKIMFREMIFGCIEIERNNLKDIKIAESNINALPKILSLIGKLFKK